MDVFRECVDNEFLRRRVMFMTLLLFFGRAISFQRMLMRADNRRASLKEWWQAMKFFWGKDGLMRESIPHFLKAFKRGFHPEDIDQKPLIENWQQRYPDVAGLQTN